MTDPHDPSDPLADVPVEETTAPPPAEPVPTQRTGTLPLLREAVRGSKQDFTEGPIGRSLVLLAVPMVLETAMESIFALADVFWVSRLGSAAVTAVGLTESFLIVVYTLAIGLSIGVTATVARRIGEKDPDAAARVAVQAIYLGVLVAALLAAIGAPLAPRLLAAMGAAPDVLAIGSGYTRIMLLGNVTIVLLFLLNGVFRGAGDAAIAMRVLWLGNAINIALGPLFIFGVGPFPALGVEGAAVATNIGRGTAVLVQLWTLARVEHRVRVRREHLAFDPRLAWSLVRLSGTGTFQIFVGSASWIVLVRLLSAFGTAAVAGHTIGMRLIMFALLPSWGLSNAAATMVGQALGARKPDRAERAVWSAAGWNAVFLGGVGIVFVVFAPWIVSAFTGEPEAARWGVLCLRIVACGFPFYAYGMVVVQAFNGAGDPWTPTWINLGVFWLLLQPMAWLLSRGTGMGPAGVFLAVAVAYSVLAVVAGALFRRGRWKSAHV